MEKTLRYPWIHTDDSRIDYHQKGSYVLTAWCEGPCQMSIQDFMDMALSNLQGHESPDYCIGTMYEILPGSHVSRNTGARIDFIVDILPLTND